MNPIARQLGEQEGEAARLDAAIAACLPDRPANLEELGYGR